MAQMSALIASNPNTTILSADTNSNNTTIRSTYNAHDVATTAVHGVSTGTLAYWLSSGDFGVNATNKLFLDGRAGGGDTYITEASANTIRIIANTRTIGQFFGGAAVTDDYFSIQATSRFYLDGGSDTYITEASANTIRIIANTRTIGQFFGGAAVTDDYFSIQATSKLYFDGGGDTYEVESSANVLDRYSGGVLALRTTATTAVIHTNATFNTSGEVLLGNVNPPTANYANRNSFLKGWAVIATSGAITSSYNVSSSSRSSTGNYVVNWDTDFSGNNFPACANGTATDATVSWLSNQALVQLTATGVLTNDSFAIITAGTQ